MSGRKDLANQLLDSAESYLKTHAGSRFCGKCLTESLGVSASVGRGVIPRLEGRGPRVTVRYGACARCANVRLVAAASDEQSAGDQAASVPLDATVTGDTAAAAS